MPYKSREEYKRYNRERMRKARVAQEGCTGEGEKGVAQVGLHRYPAIVEALADPDKRAKLERICEELGKRGLQREVRFGIAGPTFDVVGELLDITH